MRAEMLSPTFNPHLENFLHRQDGYIISKKKLSTAPIACREDSRIKFSLLNCHDLTQLPSAFSFPVLMGFFLALYANMKIYRRAPGRAILQLFKRFPLSPFTLCCQARRASPLQRGAQAYDGVLKDKGTVAILSVIAQVKQNYMTTELFKGAGSSGGHHLQPPAQAIPPRSGCTGHCQAEGWVPPRMVVAPTSLGPWSGI